MIKYVTPLLLAALAASAAIPPQPAEGPPWHPWLYDYAVFRAEAALPLGFVGSLEFVGGELILTTSLPSGRFHRYDPASGALADLGDAPLGVSGSFWDGECLWLAGNGAELWRYDGSLKSVENWGEPYGERWYIELPSWRQTGLARVGEDFWLVDELGVIYLWRLGEAAPRGEYIVGQGRELACDGENLWLLSHRGIIKLTTGGEILGRIPLPATEGFASGLAWDGERLWLAINAEDRTLVWSLDPGEAELMPLGEPPEDRRDAVEYD
ncbi:MAG: hypothetical protein A2Y64_05220 [Candidatus Coatesbacteria bacterium RBG_13_66_14]|uniref:SMP-30/Gluconolactonase/LRE-like region domain-containing protein n=1 Tax=Candidatus Coatesbacteria bacterium RBG_13_66_14 TaxID=1817816 RepID=A0A1F5F4W7_9BACT|nr:MAG: hypothetical protein A2Y64_05220 [Candidatus Coatesbacteria bacterium RBG_13_66_14]